MTRRSSHSIRRSPVLRTFLAALVAATAALGIVASEPAAAATVAKSSTKSSRIKAVVPARRVAVAPERQRTSRGKVARRSVAATTTTTLTTRTMRSARGVRLRRASIVVIPARPSMAQSQGLRLASDESIAATIEDNLAVKSSVALVMDEGNKEILYSRNANVALPIASITKLMTALVVLDAKQSMEEMVTITSDDLDTEKFSRSRLAVGTVLPRRDLMHLALMSSENRAAHALARNYPGGLDTALGAMNAKARALGMTTAQFHDPTGLSSLNVASAEDLAKLVNAASYNATIREFSTDQNYSVPVGRRMVDFHNTNALVASPAWEIVVQKTGYISEAGKCLVMKAMIEGRSIVIVLLDSFGKYTRLGDANRVRQWLEGQATDPVARLIRKTS